MFGCGFFFFFFFNVQQEGIGVNKDCASEIRCRVSFAVLSVSSAVSVLPRPLWELTITIFFFPLFFCRWIPRILVWKLLPTPSIKHYLFSFSERELQEIPIYLQSVIFDMDLCQGHSGLQRNSRSPVFYAFQAEELCYRYLLFYALWNKSMYESCA